MLGELIEGRRCAHPATAGIPRRLRGGQCSRQTAVSDLPEEGNGMEADSDLEIWRDPRYSVDERVADLLARMTPAEKIAQLGSVWLDASADSGGVAPMQDIFSDETPPFDELISHGLGQLTRVFGTRPVDPGTGMRTLATLQARAMAANRFGIPAVAHEECLTGTQEYRQHAIAYQTDLDNSEPT
jgi:hypothetical protein